MEKKHAHETTKTNPGFSLFLATPWEFQKTLRIFGRRGASRKRPTSAKRADSCNHLSQKTLFFQVFWPQNGLALICGPRFFSIDLVRRRRFSTLFFEAHFRSEFSPKRYYTIKRVVSALFMSAERRENLGL